MYQRHHQSFFSEQFGEQLEPNLLDQQTVDVPSLNAFKNSLSRIRDNRSGFFMD